MLDPLIVHRAKRAIQTFMAIFVAAFVLEQSMGIMGNAHPTQGYVQIKTVSKFSHIRYVEPWAVVLHHLAVGTMLASIGMIFVVFAICAAIKIRTPQP